MAYSRLHTIGENKMSYKLDKPFTDKQRADFIVEYNHKQGLTIEETDKALYALHPYEILQGDEVVDNTEEYEKEQAQKERARLDLLNLTKADVLLALYEDKGITPDNIKEMLKDNVPALIKFDYASSYYRGDAVVNTLGLALGYTTEEMDYLFENKAFPPKVEEPADTDSDADADIDSDADADADTDSDNDTDLDSDTDNKESELTE